MKMLPLCFLKKKHEAELLEEIVIYQVDDKKVNKTGIN